MPRDGLANGNGNNGGLPGRASLPWLNRTQSRKDAKTGPETAGSLAGHI
jgi:hypothetical protein